MKILVTGASGFIGGRLANALSAGKDAEIVATGRSATDRFENISNIRYFTHDLSEELPQQACDVCIHCAGLADDRATWKQYEAGNVVATRNVLTAVKHCKVLVFISSASVYDFSDGNDRLEEDATADSSLSMYGRSKYEAEMIVRNSGIPSVYILRPRAVYGNGDRVLLPRILGMIRKGRMMVPRTLSKRTSLTNIGNLCEAVQKAILQAKPGVHVFNIADKKEYDLKQVLGEILERKTGKRVFVEIPTGVLRALSLLSPLLGRNAKVTSQSLDYITQNSVMSIEKAERALNYRGEHEFFSTIDRLIG
jgi:nucleoside-diphosphate-sugar epimerase